MPLDKSFGLKFRSGLVVVAGAILFASSPATAQKLVASSAFRQAAEAARESLNAGDVTTAYNRIAALTASSALERYMLASLKFELAARRNDYRAQQAAIGELLASGAAPASQTPYLRYLQGFFSAQLGEADIALARLTEARKAGYDSSDMALLMADLYLRQRRGAEALNEVNHAIAIEDAAGRQVQTGWLERGSAIAYGQKNWPVFVSLTARRMAMPAGPGEWRSVISSYIEGAAPDKEMQLDLYRLQSAAGALASERDYHAYSRLAAELGYAAEAKSVIEDGRKRGKLLLDDVVTKPLLASVNTKAAAGQAEALKLKGKASSVASGTSAMKGGDALLAAGAYADAVAFYDQAIVKGGIDKDKANLRLGIALARSGNAVRAKSVFGQVSGRLSPVAAYWTSFVTNPSLSPTG